MVKNKKILKKNTNLILNTEDIYYRVILSAIQTSKQIPNNVLEIPQSLFWKTDRFNDDTLMRNKITNIIKSQKIQKHKLTKIAITKSNHTNECSKIFDLLYPSISPKGLETQCKQLIDGISQITYVMNLISFSL